MRTNVSSAALTRQLQIYDISCKPHNNHQKPTYVQEKEAETKAYHHTKLIKSQRKTAREEKRNKDAIIQSENN